MVSIGIRESRRRKYYWETGDQLKSVIDKISGLRLEYTYDSFGVPEAERVNGIKLPLYRYTTIRHMDDTGNVYETKPGKDRAYGRGGQLITANGREYRYDDCGDLVRKKEADGRIWDYAYHPSGMLEKVTRPDGKEVSFAYDPLGRRVSKEFDGKTTKFLWDGDKIIHEWMEEAKSELEEQPTEAFTWLFDEDSFTPIAKLTSDQIYTIISNQVGTPNAMLDQNGKAVWKAEYDIYGKPYVNEGGKTAETKCPFRFPGQYEDEETGLYYNRFRYYAPQDGIYTQRDPIGLAGENPTIYGYVSDPNVWIDVFGLVAELYYLVAAKDGFYNVVNFKGPMTPKGVYLRAGDIWKIGETTQFSNSGMQKRYSQKWLKSNNLKYKTVMRSPNSSAKKSFQNIEANKIKKYKLRRGKLPPGNKCMH